MSSSSRPKDAKSELKMKMHTSGKKKTGKNKGEKRFVSFSEKNERKRKKSYMGSSKEKDLSRKNQMDFCSSSDDEEGFECLGENNVRKAFILSGNIVPNTSSSSSDTDEEIVEYEVLSKKKVKNGSFYENVRGLRPNEFSRNDITEPVSCVGGKRTPHVDEFFENLSGDSDEEGFATLGEKRAKKVTFSKNVVSMNGKSGPVQYVEVKSVPHLDDFVENVGVDSNGSTDKSFDQNAYELESNCEEDMDDGTDKENEVVLDRRISRYRGFSGMEVNVNFDNSSDEEVRASMSQKKVPRVRKFAGLKPVTEGKARKAAKSNFSKGECSNKTKCSFKEKVRWQRKKSARNNELIRILLSTVNRETNVENNGMVHEPLASKFRFEDEVMDPTPEQTDRDKEVDSLFLELYNCLQMFEIESANLSKTENENAASKVVCESSAASCAHDPVLDEQIGSVCRFCGVILVEIRDILPPWYIPCSKQQERKYFGELPNLANDQLQSHNSVNGPNDFIRVRGTVWDLIPGVEKELFPHQSEGFEFLWKNIAGDIAIEKLPESLSGVERGYIISHAPGTGKTRLVVVFLLSFLKHYPKARPVIIAPQVILSTWENELKKWNADVSFHNMNSQKLSGNETRFEGGTVGQGVRLAKLLSWIGGGGILGISYTLFATLALNGEKGGDEEAVWEALVKMPGLLVLDEGYTPRNGNACIFNALKKVTTKRCIILSGTLFHNSFKELNNLLGLVDPRLHKMGKSLWKKLAEGTNELEELHSSLDPYVHYHRGSVLQKSLPGLNDTMIFLRPSELQKALMDACKEEEVFLALTYSISLVSIHPSALMADEKSKFVKSNAFSLFKNKLEEIESDLDEGVKIKFVMSLIQLADAVGERVLVFSHYRYPLMFIKKQLQTHFSWKEGREVLYMDGEVSEKHRQLSISLFNNSSSEAKVLLASQKACSDGINLVAASRVILLTTSTNPSVERQAISRAYRLGQKKVVYVYRLITSGTEVKQYELQARKDQIPQLIIPASAEHAGASESPCEIFEDKILEQIQNLESFKDIFEKIVHKPKESDFLGNSRFKDL